MDARPDYLRYSLIKYNCFVQLASGWWLVLICCERKILVADADLADALRWVATVLHYNNSYSCFSRRFQSRKPKPMRSKDGFRIPIVYEFCMIGEAVGSAANGRVEKWSGF